jgi:hypothetical protein
LVYIFDFVLMFFEVNFSMGSVRPCKRLCFRVRGQVDFFKGGSKTMCDYSLMAIPTRLAAIDL